MSTITTLFVATVYLFCLLLPGLAFVSVLGIRRHRFLFSYAVSMSVLSFSLVLAPLFRLTWLGWLIFICAVLSVAVLILWSRHRSDRAFSVEPQSQPSVPATRLRPTNIFLGFLLVELAVVAYQLIAGPYTEIPSDFWEHLGRVGSFHREITDGMFGIRLHNTATYDNPIYSLHGLVSLFFSTLPVNTASGGALAGVMIFVGSIYWFSATICKRFLAEETYCVFAAILTTILTALTFGTATFAYFRYYAYFPTIFCWPIVFLCICIFQDFQRGESRGSITIASLTIFLATIGLSHLQEALFVVILISGLIVFDFFKQNILQRRITETRYRPSGLLFWILVCVVLVSSAVLLYFGSPKPWINTPHAISLSDRIPFFGGLPIANPSFRFWDTLGIFGVAAYLIFFSNIRFFARESYLFVGMLSPLVTHFNPFFSYLFLHVSPATTLWRTAYLMPLSLIVSVFLVGVLSKAEKTLSVRTFGILGISAFVSTTVLLSETDSIVNRTSRLPSLYSVERVAGHLLWDDLIQTVQNITEEKKIRGVLTDHVTQFVLDAAVFRKTPIRQSREYFPANNHDYKDDLLYSDFSHHLVVVNKRDGQETGSSRLSGHWGQTILKVSDSYPADLDEFIDRHPQLFIKIWEENSIKIYEMLPKQ
jgi:hypothetical protein